MKSSVILIANPAAQKASHKKVAAASSYLQSNGYHAEAVFTKKRGDAEDFARAALSRKPSLVVACGGDGTFNEVANALAGSDVPMAILPLGTTNVLARELRVAPDVRSAMEKATHGNATRVSLGKITFTGPRLPFSRYFILMAGMGFDATAVRGTSESLKKSTGQAAYIYSGIKSLMMFRPSLLTFSVEGRTYEGYSGVAGNAALYGGPFSVTPHADLQSPFLYLCIFKSRKRMSILRYVFGVVTGTHLRYRDVEYLKAERIDVGGRADVQIDGDYVGETPATIEVVPDALTIMC